MKSLTTFLLVIVSFSVFSQNKSQVIERYIKRHVENGKFNGNLLITKGDQVLYSKSFGFADRAHKIENCDSTKFLIGSITKTFTALAILILEEEEKLKLNDKLSKYFPDFQSANKITVAQLLTHTAGIGDYRMLQDWKADSQSEHTTPYTTISKMSNMALLSEPGERFRYSNVGYILLGLIIEKVSQLSFADFIQNKILNPLQLKNTGIIDNQTIIYGLAQGYSSNSKETIKAEYINYQQPFSSGNMYSTTQDLLKFTKAVINGKLISQERTKAIFETGQYYGYGWGIRNFNGIRAYGHHGGMNGFIGSITYIPEGNYFICLLTNDNNTPKVRITNDLVDIILGKVVPLPESTQLIELTKEVQQEVIGNYLVKPGDTLKVFEEGGKLYLQENGQTKHEMFPFDQNSFSFTLLEFNAIFEERKNDKAQVLKFKGRETILMAERIND